jgi:hypothetical protein
MALVRSRRIAASVSVRPAVRDISHVKTLRLAGKFGLTRRLGRACRAALSLHEGQTSDGTGVWCWAQKRAPGACVGRPYHSLPIATDGPLPVTRDTSRPTSNI